MNDIDDNIFCIFRWCLSFPLLVACMTVYFHTNLRDYLICSSREEQLRFNLHNFWESKHYPESLTNLVWYHPFEIAVQLIGWLLCRKINQNCIKLTNKFHYVFVCLIISLSVSILHVSNMNGTKGYSKKKKTRYLLSLTKFPSPPTLPTQIWTQKLWTMSLQFLTLPPIRNCDET